METNLLRNSRAREDVKSRKLIDKFGMTGYGFFWEIVNLLHREGKLSRITIARKLGADFSETNNFIKFCLSERLLNVAGNIVYKTEYISLIENTGIYKIEEQKM